MNTRKPIGLMHHRRRSEQGFTLIELLVVIAILAILAVIVLFNVVGVANKGKSASCNTDISTIQTAVDGYLSDHGDFVTQPATTASILTALQQPPSGSPYIHALNGGGKSGTSCPTSFSISGNLTSGYTVSGS